MQTKGQFFAITHAPGAATQATISQAAGGAGVFNHATCISATFASGATGGTGTLNLRDGATGAGTVLQSWDLSAITLTSIGVYISGVDIPGSANTAMTLEFAAAGAATTLEKVNLVGYFSNSPNAAWTAL
jgi:hypothetical protein